MIMHLLENRVTDISRAQNKWFSGPHIPLWKALGELTHHYIYHKITTIKVRNMSDEQDQIIPST